MLRKLASELEVNEVHNKWVSFYVIYIVIMALDIHT